MSSNGPMRKPPPSRQMRSICSTVAIRSDRSLSASRPQGRLQRLTRNPGPSTASITRLPIASPQARATASARSEDSAPATTSSSAISGGGLKKCMPTTRSGWVAAGASAVTSSDEVLLASTQSAPTISESSAKSRCLSSTRSGAASMTSSQSAKPSSVGAACSCSLARSASAAAIRPLLTSRSSWRRIRLIPRSSASASGSCSSVRMPATQPSCAIPDPIVPAPATPSTVGASPAALTRGSAR